MNIFDFLSYIIFNRGGNRQLVWNAFKDNFRKKRLERVKE